VLNFLEWGDPWRKPEARGGPLFGAGTHLWRGLGVNANASCVFYPGGAGDAQGNFGEWKGRGQKGGYERGQCLELELEVIFLGMPGRNAPPWTKEVRLPSGCVVRMGVDP
jgi:hypothetical protein